MIAFNSIQFLYLWASTHTADLAIAVVGAIATVLAAYLPSKISTLEGRVETLEGDLRLIIQAIDESDESDEK